MPDPTTDIDELASFLSKVVECDSMRCDSDDARPWIAALTALVAERDALKTRVMELESHPPADRDLSAKIDELSSSVSILMCRVAALESAKFFGPHVPVNPWNPYPTTPWIIYGTRTSDRIEESA